MTPEENRLTAWLSVAQRQCDDLVRVAKGASLKLRVAECKAVSLEHELTELRKYTGTLEDQIADMTVDPVVALRNLRVPEFSGILKRAKSLWPQRKDLNPRTLREDAMLNVVIALINECYQAVANPVYERAADATRPAERFTEVIDDE